MQPGYLASHLCSTAITTVLHMCTALYAGVQRLCLLSARVLLLSQPSSTYHQLHAWSSAVSALNAMACRCSSSFNRIGHGK
jgi:RecB family endonuclease NucS